MLYRAFQSEHAIAEVLQAATRRILPARSEKKKTRQSVSSLHGQAAFRLEYCRRVRYTVTSLSFFGLRVFSLFSARNLPATDPRCCYRAVGDRSTLLLPCRTARLTLYSSQDLPDTEFDQFYSPGDVFSVIPERILAKTQANELANVYRV